jgi:TIR domain
MNGESSDYDIFLSYARSDNLENEGYVEKLVATVSSVYHDRTGRDLRIFMDLDEIATAQIWERKINAALRRSSIMISVLSPAYFRSPWCGREWDSFIRMSQDRSITYGITPYLNLIFPITLREWALEDQRSREARRRVREARDMQYVDFAGVSPEADRFTPHVIRLVDDMIDVLEMLEEVTPGAPLWPDAALPSISPESPMITTRRARDRFQFIRVLADAVNVTIVGVTNENLADFLSDALERKQRRLGAGAFWESLRIVFLREDLLNLVNDQLEAQRPRPGEPFMERKLRAKAGKRAVVSFLVRQDQPERWSLHEYGYHLPFLGVLFGMADGANLVQITMARPRQSVSDALYFEFVDPADHYFENAFHDVIADSREENEVVLVGTPGDGAGFHVNGARFRRSALREGQNTHEWLPSVVIATWTVRQGIATPMIQIRTESNATHYINHLSHVSGYVNENDFVSSISDLDWPVGSPVTLPSVAARAAACRELQEQLNLTVEDDQLQFYRTCRFNNHDRENLFFYLFALQLSTIHQLPEDSQIRSWKISDLLALHEYQVLSKAEHLLRLDDLSSTQRVEAARILACQLTLHGQLELGRRLIRAAQRPANTLAGHLHRLAGQRAVRLRLSGNETTLSGLAEIHYREFFSTLLPLYAQVGVPDAERIIARLESVDGAGDALAKLSEAYRDDDLLSSLPFEV